MNQILTFLFWPNPGNADYTSPKALALLIVCILLIVASFALPFIRNRSTDGQWKKLSRTWATACGWFGWSGLILVVCRVEEIQYVAMRFLWVLWGLALFAYLVLQLKLYRSRYYQVIPSQPSTDSRAAYLPGKKKR